MQLVNQVFLIMQSPKLFGYFLSAAFLMSINSFAQYNEAYKDSTIGPTFNTRPLSILQGYLMVGVELPLKPNTYIEFNVGMPGFRKNYFMPGGVLIRASLKLPFLYTTPYNVIYWGPEVYYGTFKARNYNCDTCTFNDPDYFFTYAWTASVNVGYRHQNPKTRFVFDAGFGLGYGAFKMKGSGEYIHYGVRFFGPRGITNSSNQLETGMIVTGHIAVGYNFRRK